MNAKALRYVIGTYCVRPYNFMDIRFVNATKKNAPMERFLCDLVKIRN
jgi:hypothetical protein